MRDWQKRIGVLFAVCLLCVLPVQAAEVMDADYSAALIRTMGQGAVPEERVLDEIIGQTVREVATDKISYTSDVLTVRELPGTEYDEISKLAKYAQIHVIGACDNGWSRVEMENGTVGYVSNEYLTDLVPEGAEDIGESLGLFTVTYYCSCEVCCGWWSGGPTASGVYPTGDWTIAADPEVLAMGTHVYIGGHEYCVEDTGSGVEGAHVDIYVTDHNLAVNNGVGYAEVFAKKE